MTTNQQIAAFAQADRAIYAYDEFIFGAVGRPWGQAEQQTATVLAFYAADECAKVARAAGVAPWCVAEYAARAAEFRAIQ